VSGILGRLASTTPAALERAIDDLSEQRERIGAALDRATRDLRVSRESETTPIIVGGESVSPIAAAKWCRAATEKHAWIPGVVAPGSALTLTPDEVEILYASNEGLSPEDAAELVHPLPEPSEILTPAEFAA